MRRIRVRSPLLLPIALSLLVACQIEANTPAAPPPAAQARAPLSTPAAPAALPSADEERQAPAMYQAVVDAFFDEDQVRRLFQPDLLRHKTVYVRPTFSNTDTPVPDAILRMIAARTDAYGLAAASSEQAGGAVIALGALGHDPEAATIVPRGGPTIQISASISGGECGASISMGYLIVATEAGWQARQYVLAVC